MDSTQSIAARLHKVRESLAEGVGLVAISKYHPAEHIMAAYAEGQRVFGESHEQELRKKASELPRDIEWHFIGHLQTNKVKYIAPYISMIESVDSLRLLREIDKQAARCGRIVRVLLELRVAQEDTKYGLSIAECRSLLDAGEWRSMPHVQICGLMAMASNTSDTAQISREFMQAYAFFNEAKDRYFADKDYFSIRSWGMSSDYRIACQCHTNMVRVGTAIFGERVY